MIVVSRHFFRRTARAVALKRNGIAHVGKGTARYEVQRASRGPYRWYVTRRS